MRTQEWTTVLWAAIAALSVVSVVAGFLWLPYQEPATNVPWEVEILPGPSAAPQAGSKQPNQNYGWVDRNAGIVHIPVEQAMELTAKRLSAP
jgi:hypothetical protein